MYSEEPMLKLRKLIQKDLKFLLEVRNDESTRSQLGDDSIFTLKEAKEWYRNLKYPWYIIEDTEGNKVGYLRTNENNEIGCDIHPNHRKKGYGTKAYKLWLADKEDAYLWVFEYNEIAVKLYKNIGFIKTDEYKNIVRENENSIRKYIKMTWRKPKFASVVAFYEGPRLMTKHSDYCNDWYGLELAKLIIGYAEKVEAGLNYDTIIVINRKDFRAEELTRVENYLKKHNNKKTKNGKFIIEFRENKGISFGAYNHAFDKYKDDYDYFFFTEDDYLWSKKNWYLQLYTEYEYQTKTVNEGIGMLCAKGTGSGYTGAHCHGGIGLASTTDMKYAFNIDNYSEISDDEGPHFENNFTFDGEEYLVDCRTGFTAESAFTSRLHNILGKEFTDVSECLYSKFFHNYNAEIGNPELIGPDGWEIEKEDLDKSIKWDIINQHWSNNGKE